MLGQMRTIRHRQSLHFSWAMHIGPDMPLSTKDIVSRLDITPLTVVNWRKGTPRRKPLPSRVVGARMIRRVVFDEYAVTRWLAKYRPDLLDKWYGTDNKR